MKKNILFISHDASRTGAPIVLKHFINWVKKQGDFSFSILLKRGGDIEPGFRQQGPVYTWSPYLPKESFWGKLQTKAVRFFLRKPVYKAYPPELQNTRFDLVYFNTVASTDLLPYIKAHHNCPVILHVHENDFTIKANYPELLSKTNVAQIDHFIAVSESTRQSLVKSFGVPSEKISLVYEFADIKNPPAPKHSVKEIKDLLHLEDEFIVGGAGVTSWRKGIDIFTKLAQIILKNYKGKIKFIWVGEWEHPFKHQFAYELDRLGLSADDIILTGSIENPHDYFAAFDVFALTSREDPFPLVALEAASLAKPIICFADAGGMPELIKAGGGIIVPYADTEKMAAAIISIYYDRPATLEMGKSAKEKVQQFDIDVQAPKIMAIINAQMGRTGPDNLVD